LPRIHIRQRGQTALFRRIIPHDLRARFGRREIIRSLGHASAGEARRLSQRYWDATETLFMLVRFDRKLSQADVARLAEQHLEGVSYRHDRALASVGHYPDLDAFREEPPEDAGPGLTRGQLVCETTAPEGPNPQPSLNDPATWATLYADMGQVLRRARAQNDFTLVRGAAQELALKNEIDLDSASEERLLCRALLDAELKIAEEKLAYLNEIILPHHPGHRQAISQIVELASKVTSADKCVESEKTNEGEKPRSVELRNSHKKFSEIWVSYSEDRVSNGDWKKSIERQNKSTGRLFASVCGDKPLCEYGPADAANFKRALLKLPSKYDKTAAWRDLYLREGPLALIAHVGDDLGIPRLQPQTFNRHLAALSGIWNWAAGNEVIEKGLASIFEGLHINLRKAKAKSKRRQSRDDRPMWETDELSAIFQAPLFLGARSRRSWKKPGSQVFRDERYWGVLIGCHSGMRRQEIFQLRVRHVVRDKDTGIWYFDLMSIDVDTKAVGSLRFVPLHSNLLELGFIKARIQGRDPDDLLFPEAKPYSERQSPGDPFGKWFREFRLHYGVREEVVFHSLRHTVSTLLCRTNVKESFVEELVGHESSKRESELGRYNKGQTLIMLRDLVDQIVLPIDVDALVSAAAKSQDLIRDRHGKRVTRSTVPGF
jgi:integrase